MKDVTIINLFDLPDGGQRPRNSRFNGKNSLEEDENKRAHTSIGQCKNIEQGLSLKI